MMNIYVRNRSERVPTSYERGLVVDFLEPARSTLDTDIENRLAQRLGRPPAPAIDLLLLAGAAYVADKRVARSETPDRWTRRFTLSLPTENQSTWQRIERRMSRLLGFLSGDEWILKFRNGTTQLRQYPEPLKLETYDAVTLFSGGLDSCVGAIDLLEEGKRVILVGHYDALHTKVDQEKVFEPILQQYRDQVKLIQVRLRPALRRTGQEYPLTTGVKENTTRTRSLVFLSLGTAVAATIGESVPLYVPENGFISINTPLITARLGSLSTRTTHPFTIDAFREIVRELGLSNEVRTPYETVTKGEMLQRCKNKRLLRTVAAMTVSCSHPEAGRWRGYGYGHCGYCLPCIVRRAAMTRVGLSESYQVDIRKPSGRIPTGGADLQAVWSAISDWKKGDRRVVWNGRIPGDQKRRTELDDVRIRGLKEIERMLRAS